MLQQLELLESASKWHCRLEVWIMELGNEEWPVESPGGARESRGGGRWDVPERKSLTVCGTYTIAFPRQLCTVQYRMVLCIFYQQAENSRVC